MYAIDSSGRVPARNFKHRGQRFIFRLEDEFLEVLFEWAERDGIAPGHLVERLTSGLPEKANRSAIIRTEIIQYVTRERDRKAIEVKRLLAGFDSIIERLPLPIFGVEGERIESFNPAFSGYIQQKLNFPAGLAMKFISKSRISNPTTPSIQGSIILPGFVLPVRCEPMNVSWSHLTHYAIS